MDRPCTVALQLEFLNELLVTPRNMMKVLNHHPVPLRGEIASNSISFVRLENFRVAIFYPRKKHDASSLCGREAYHAAWVRPG